MNIRAIFAQATRRPLSPPLRFLHMPKAGETGLVNSIEALLRPRTALVGIDQSQAGDFASFETMAPGLRASVIVTMADIPTHVDIMAGHFALSNLTHRFADICLVTILREPCAQQPMADKTHRSMCLPAQPAIPARPPSLASRRRACPAADRSRCACGNILSARGRSVRSADPRWRRAADPAQIKNRKVE